MGPSTLNIPTAMSAHPANAEITDCDRLAANPPDPDRIVAGIPREQVDLPRAIDACRAAVAVRPDVGRFAYQLGRVLFYSGHVEEAMATFRQAAELGYRQAHFIIGYISVRRSRDVKFDPAVIEYHWRISARMDHFNAQIGYVHEYVRGTFKGLKDVCGSDEMLRFLDRAKPHMVFAGEMLIENLTDALKS